MTIPFEALEAEAMKLEPGDRARLAEHLIASLDEDPSVDAAWAEEVAQHIAALDAGEIETLSAAEVFSRVNASIR